MSLRILVTGASSFVGAHFCRVAARSHHVLGLHHQTPLGLSGVTPVRCDLRHPAAAERLAGLEVDLVVHLACKVMGEGIEKTNRRWMDVVMSLERPVLYGSSTVVHWPDDTAYARVRREDEERLAKSDLPWAVLRPCAPYGPRLREHQPRHTESFQRLADWIKRFPHVPVPGDGNYRRQPVHVHDFSESALVLIEQGLPSRAFDAGGPEAMSFNTLVDEVGLAVGRQPVRKVHLPPTVFGLLGRVSGGFNPELLAAVVSDDIADPGALAQATGIEPRSFAEGARCLR